MTAGNLVFIFLLIFLEAPQKWLQHFSVCQWQGPGGSSRKQQKHPSLHGPWEEGDSMGTTGEDDGVTHCALSIIDKWWTCMVCSQIFSYETPAQAVIAGGSSDWLRTSSQSVRYKLKPGRSLWPGRKHQHGSLRLPKVYFQLLAFYCCCCCCTVLVLLYCFGGMQHIPFASKAGPAVVVVIYGK